MGSQVTPIGVIDAMKSEHRPGPRPLALHVATETLTWLSLRAAFPSLRNGLLPWRPGLAAIVGELEADLGGVPADAILAAIDGEARRRLSRFARGVDLYRRAARRPRPPSPPLVWAEGSTRLLDYGGADGGASRGHPVLVIPSLINRAHILDLSDELSLLRLLSRAGVRPLLVDWGQPRGFERSFRLDDYIAGRLERALAAVHGLDPRPPAVIGYCMGGLLALALAHRCRDRIAALALLATPWDFHADNRGHVRMLAAVMPALEALVERAGVMSVDVLQAMFASIDPYATPEKFRRLADTDPRSDTFQHFLAVEDWVNDGVPLAGPVALECLRDWYVENAPHMRRWRIRGRAIDPREVDVPTLVAIPGRDRIVPPASATALADALPNAEPLPVAAGHVGMVAGSRAPTLLHEPLARWLSQRLL